MDQQHEKLVANLLDGAGNAAGFLGDAIGGPAAAVGLSIKGILHALVEALRVRGRSVDDLIALIKTPRELDMSFRNDVDERVRELPEKPRP